MFLNFGVFRHTAFDNKQQEYATNGFLKSGLAMFNYTRKTSS